MTPAEVAAVIAGGGPIRRNGRGFRVLCPAHDNHSPSLDIDPSDDGKVLILCRSCGANGSDAVEKVAGLTLADLMRARIDQRERDVEIVPTLAADLLDLRATTGEHNLDPDALIVSSRKGTPLNLNNWRNRTFNPAALSVGVVGDPVHGPPYVHQSADPRRGVTGDRRDDRGQLARGDLEALCARVRPGAQRTVRAAGRRPGSRAGEDRCCQCVAKYRPATPVAD